MLNSGELAKKAIDILQINDLAEMTGRAFDNAFSVFARKDQIKFRIVIIGFNGSNADNNMTNKEALEKDIKSGTANIEEAIGWSRLANQLKKIPDLFGLEYHDIVYTNAILTCSKDAQSLSKSLYGTHHSNKSIIQSSMNFLCDFTLDVFDPQIIICHGNAEKSLSTANILRERFDGHEIFSLDETRFGRSYYFYGTYKDQKIPILCLRHLSRYQLNESAIKKFKTRHCL